jgi:hypothetical protein
LRDLIGQGGGTFAAIEGVVGIPKWLPSYEVGGLDGAMLMWGGMVFTLFLIALCAYSIRAEG